MIDIVGIQITLQVYRPPSCMLKRTMKYRTKVYTDDMQLVNQYMWAPHTAFLSAGNNSTRFTANKEINASPSQNTAKENQITGVRKVSVFANQTNTKVINQKRNVGHRSPDFVNVLGLFPRRNSSDVTIRHMSDVRKRIQIFHSKP